MPQLVLDARSNGLIVEATVWFSAQRRAAMYKKGLEVSPKILVTLIIDTGADSTMLNSQCMRSLGINPTGQARVLTSGSRGVAEPCDIYDIELEIANPTQRTWRFPALEVLARPLENQSTDGMLGRDVLKQGILHYDGPRSRFTLDYS